MLTQNDVSLIITFSCSWPDVVGYGAAALRAIRLSLACHAAPHQVATPSSSSRGPFERSPALVTSSQQSSTLHRCSSKVLAVRAPTSASLSPRKRAHCEN